MAEVPVSVPVSVNAGHVAWYMKRPVNFRWKVHISWCAMAYDD